IRCPLLAVTRCLLVEGSLCGAGSLCVADSLCVLCHLCVLCACARNTASGRTLSIKAHRVDGGSLVLTLRSGGEVICDASTIARFAPDEVPYPEPEPIVTEVALPPAAAVPYGELIDKFSTEHGVDAKLVRAVIQVESAYRNTARSRKGAMGLMQLMPDTARQYGVKDPYDPASNIEGGVKYLKALLQR